MKEEVDEAKKRSEGSAEGFDMDCRGSVVKGSQGKPLIGPHQNIAVCLCACVCVSDNID